MRSFLAQATAIAAVPALVVGILVIDPARSYPLAYGLLPVPFLAVRGVMLIQGRRDRAAMKEAMRRKVDALRSEAEFVRKISPRP